MTAARPDAIVIAKANCGVPVVDGGHVHYSGTPELMADYVRLAVDAGARIIGGCCGTSPEHLAAMRDGARRARQGRRGRRVDDIVARVGPLVAPPPSEETAEGSRARRRAAGARHAAPRGCRAAPPRSPTSCGKIPLTEILDEEGLAIIERQCRDDPSGDRHRVPRASALARAPQGGRRRRQRHARPLSPRPRPAASARPARASSSSTRATRSATCRSAATTTVFAPVYGSPFVHDLDRGRRYGTIEDFANFVKLAYQSPFIHHSGGTVCEPVDLPVNKRHLEMVYAHMRWSDKAYMGSVTHPLRAADTVAMSRILFGEKFLDDHVVCMSLINANSPLVWDCDHARRGRDLCRGQPGGDHHAVHPLRRDEPGDGRRHAGAGARRGAGRHRLRPARAARVRRWCSAPSSRRCRCSRAPRPSARPRRRSPSTARASWRGG